MESGHREVADEDVARRERPGRRRLVHPGAPRQHEVRLRRQDVEAEALKAGGEPLACRADAGDVRPHGRQIAERRQRGDLREAADVVRVLHGAEAGEQLRVTEGEPDAEARQRERLRERSQHEDVRQAPDEPEGVGGGEVDVRLVDDQHAVHLAGQRLDCGEPHQRARGRVRVAEEGHARARPAERGR